MTYTNFKNAPNKHKSQMENQIRNPDAIKREDHESSPFSSLQILLKDIDQHIPYCS